MSDDSPRPPVARIRASPTTLAEVAFEYERALLEVETAAATKERALAVISQIIVPLMGHVRLNDVSPELEEGVRLVIAAQVNDDWPGGVWADMVRWGRSQAARRT